jgi:hypothetical protein
MAYRWSDSYGGLDLYVSFRTGEKFLVKPVNLGPEINTAANDYSPFLAADGVTHLLFYCRHQWIWQEDIFVSRRLDDTWMKWSEPMNMGKPINSSESDSKFSIPASGSYAFFSSKEGSVGLYDIFRILLPDTAKPQAVALLKGSILDVTTKDPVGGAIIIYKNYPDEAIIIREISDSYR